MAVWPVRFGGVDDDDGLLIKPVPSVHFYEKKTYFSYCFIIETK